AEAAAIVAQNEVPLDRGNHLVPVLKAAAHLVDQHHERAFFALKLVAYRGTVQFDKIHESSQLLRARVHPPAAVISRTPPRRCSGQAPGGRRPLQAPASPAWRACRPWATPPLRRGR